MTDGKPTGSMQELADLRKRYSGDILDRWRDFSRQVFKENVLSEHTKELIAVAVAHVTQCPDCIRIHTRKALKHGITPEELMEAIWVAAEMRSGAAIAHSSIALEEVLKHSSENG
ncbi:MAG: carboxymuconolactone decarboxylase family protein [Candidatus Omnitrophica bacterium]|nr:carboxymuconolactone decarboxylase family protein [Candidatus Omnitrophota bacterium]